MHRLSDIWASIAKLQEVTRGLIPSDPTFQFLHVRLDHASAMSTMRSFIRQLPTGPIIEKFIGGMEMPETLVELTFRSSSYQPTECVYFPASLNEVNLLDDFDQPVSDVVWPSSLVKLTFGSMFAHPVIGTVWPRLWRKFNLGNILTNRLSVPRDPRP